MKKYISPILFTLLLGLVTIRATAQSWTQKFDFGITYSSLNKQNKLASVFNLLASNDNKNVNDLSLQLNFEIHYSIVNTRDGKVILKYSINNQKMTGTVFFRNFKVDSLLLPEKFVAKLLFYEDDRLTDTLTRTISFAEGPQALSLPGGISTSALSIEIKVNRVVYTSNQYRHFLKTAGLINNYYGYVKIMQNMPQLLMKTSGASPSASNSFLNYVMLIRLESYARQHNFSQLLHLKLRDPLNFEQLFGKMLRLQTRMKTLSQVAKDYPGFCLYNSKLTQNKEVTETAAAISQQTITKGAQLHDQNRNTQAITYLNSAAQLQKTFLLPDSPQLNRLITETTVPYILAIADEANLEIWRKHFQKADSVYQLAQSLSRHYGVAENQKVKNRLDALSAQIRVAGCQWKQEEISRLFTQTQRAVKAYHMDAAKSYFLKAKQLYKHDSSCKGAKEQVGNTLRSYKALFNFTDAYHKLTLQLFSHGFAAVLPEYAKLEKQYHDEHLEKFGLPYTGLYAFIRSQHSEKLTLEAVHYFIRKKSFAEALRYLQLSGNADQEKALQKQIAMGFASKNIRPQSLLLTQPAWAYFAKTYRKALSAKGR